MQKRKNAKTQKCKNAKRKDAKNAIGSGLTIFVFLCHFGAQNI